MDVAVEGGEDESGVGEDDPRDGAGEAAETVAVLRVEGGEVVAAGDVEEVDGPVRESRREVAVGEGEAAAAEAVVVVVVVVRGDEVEGSVCVPAGPEIGGSAVAVNVVLPPRLAVEEFWNVPDVSCEVFPQEIRPRYGSPRGAHLSLTFMYHFIFKMFYL